MNRWVHRFFAVLTFGPILLWLAMIIVVMVLGSVYGCRITEAGVKPCRVHGHDVGETAAMLGILAAWGPLFFGPIVVVSGAAWGLLTLIAYLRRRLRD